MTIEIEKGYGVAVQVTNFRYRLANSIVNGIVNFAGAYC